MIFLFSTTLKSILTITILLFLMTIYYLDRKLIEKNREKINKKLIVLSYFILFMLLVGTILGILLIWGYSFNLATSDLFSKFIIFIEDSVGKILGTLIALFLAMIINKIVKIALLRVGKSNQPNERRKKTIAKVTTSIVKYIVGTIAIIAILAIWGINVAPALAGLGVLGLIIGLGAQRFINDLISGFFIIFENHFNVGDTVEIKGFKGIVTDIGLKTTKIRNWKGEVKIYNNGDIGDILNFSLNPSIAVVEFGIAYKEDAQKTINILTLELPKIRAQFEQIIEDPKVLGVTDLVTNGVSIRVIAKTLTEQHYAVERGMRQYIKEILDANNISIPFTNFIIHNPKD